MSNVLCVISGALLGASLTLSGFACPDGVRGAASLTRPAQVRTLFFTLGLGMVLTALLSYLAVIDVDLLQMPPLTGGLVISAVITGAAAGLAGVLPATSLAGLGGGSLAESLCGALGCGLGYQLARLLPAGFLSDLFPPVPGTLFRHTLRDPFLLGGGFASLACLGALVFVLGLFFRVPPSEENQAPDAPDAPEPLPPSAAPESADDPVMPSPEDEQPESPDDPPPDAEDEPAEDDPPPATHD